MNELIKVTVNEKQEQIVLARELHEKLGIQKDFTSWFKYQAEKIGIIENEDYYLLTNFGEQNGSGGHNKVDYIVTIDTAKHLTMISGGEKAHEIRKYFIEVEKAWNNPEIVMARSLQFAQTKLLDYQKQIEIMQPKVEFYDAVAGSKDAIEMSQVAKVLDIGIGRNKLFELLREKKVLRETNEPYQKYIDCGYFRVIEQKFNKGDGSIGINIKTLVYQKGLDYIRKIVSE